MGAYSWIGTLLGGAFGTATTITNTVVAGQNYRAELEAGATNHGVDKEQNQKTLRTVIIAVCLVAVVIVFGLFVWSNKRK